MRKWFVNLASLILIIGLLVGCGTDDANEEKGTTSNNATEQADNNNANDEEKEETVVITISKDEGEEIITEKEISIEEDAILMDVLKSNFDVGEEGGFINSIEGVAPEEGEEKAWMYSVNDEMAQVGAGEFELTPGDKVTFDLQAY